MKLYLSTKYRIYLALFCALQLITINKFSGQNNSIYFEHITPDNGLSQGDVNSIYQDKQGFMWFATHEGLNKYDGYDFTVYNPDHNSPYAISSNLIFVLAGDKDDNLWVGTTGNGLNYFDKSLEKFIHFKHDVKNPHSISSNHINSVYRDNKDRLWVGTNRGLDLAYVENGIDSLKFKNFNLGYQQRAVGTSNNNVYKIYEDKAGQMWVGAISGLYKLTRNINGEIDFKRLNEELSLPYTHVKEIVEDRNGNLLIGTNMGLFLLKNGSRKVDIIYRGVGINSILLENKTIWVGTNKGLFWFENGNDLDIPTLTKEFVYEPLNPYSISKDIITALYKDNTGIIWIGTNGGGVNKLDLERKGFRHIKKTLDNNSLSYDKIRSIYQDSNGSLWIGTEGGGLNLLHKQNDDKSYSHFQHFNTIRKPFATLEIERNNRKILMIGAEGTPSLYEIDITNPNNLKESDFKRYAGYGGSVFALLEDSHKNIWIGTYNAGIRRWLYDKTTGSYQRDVLSYSDTDSLSVSSNIIRNIFEDSQGNIWFATGDGLSRLSPNQLRKKQPHFEIFKNEPSNPNSITHNYILELFESSKGHLWIGTMGGGLNKLIPAAKGQNLKFKSYRVRDGLPNNVVKGILEDDEGNLWISTNHGISKFNPENETFKNYDINDGLQSNEFQELARFKRSNGELLFGGINGFNAFYPERIKDNTIEAETVITNFSVSNKEIGINKPLNGRVLLEKSINKTDKIVLKHHENNFSFEFAALHYASPNKNKFAYKLEGFDEDWIYTTANKRFVNYTNLSPNNYILKVKASNNDGVWDSTPSEIAIEIIPPFWQTNIAYFIYSLMIIGLLLLFRRFTIIRTTKKHQLELEHLEKEASEELQRVKLEFFTNISHEFRTPLTLIKGPLKYLRKQGDKLDNNALQEQYNLMQKNCDYLLRLVNQLLDFRKINQGKMRLVMRKSNIVQFIKEVSEPFQFLAHKNDIKFNIVAEDDKLITWFDHDTIEKVTNNLLSNAFNYTPKRGTITVLVSITTGMDHDDLNNNFNYVVIKVKDTGTGIEHDKLENIFERFHTDKNKSMKNSKGIGIGLAFVRDMVILHQGSITVESEIDKGSTFTVSLPVEKEAYEGVPEIVCKDITDSDFEVRSSETDSIAIGVNDDILDLDIDKSRSEYPILLVVDDNADIRSFLKQTLRHKYVIYEAENGALGLELATKVLPNIILTDILMPVMDGIEFCQKIKSQKETSHIPVIMLTAKLSQESEIKGLKTGADDYIRKPFDIELLELKLQNIIKQRNKLRKRFNSNIAFQPKDVTVTTLDEQFLQQAIDIVEKHMMNTDFNVEMLVKEMGLSRSNLYLKFKEITGLSSSEFIRNIRLKRAVQLFQKSDYSVKEIMYMTGFNTASYFAKCFKKQFGVIPSEYVRQNVKDKNVKSDSEQESFS